MNTINKQRGISLVEVLVTMAILAFGLLALAKFQGTIATFSSQNKKSSIAMNIGQQKIEELRAYEILDTTAGKFAYADISSGNDSVISNNTTYARNWTVTTNTDPDYKTVRMVVSWTNRANASQSVELVSIIGRFDPLTSGTAVNTSGAGTMAPPP